jgi:hypothetical protein
MGTKNAGGFMILEIAGGFIAGFICCKIIHWWRMKPKSGS